MGRTTLDRNNTVDSIHLLEGRKEGSRTLIIGVPRAGKTTMSLELKDQHSILHIDSLVKNTDWTIVSDIVADRLTWGGDWIIEGCSGVRGLRKWLNRNQGLPPFKIVWLDKPHVEQTKGQIQFGKMCTSIWNECKQELKRRGWDG